MKRLTDRIVSRLSRDATEKWEMMPDGNAVAAGEGVLFTSRAKLVKSSFFAVFHEGVLSLTQNHLIYVQNGAKVDVPVSAISDVKPESARGHEGMKFRAGGSLYLCSFDRLSSPSVNGSLLQSGELGDSVQMVGAHAEVFSSRALRDMWIQALGQVTGRPPSA